MSQSADARLIQAVGTAHAFKPSTSTTAALAQDPGLLLQAGVAGMSLYTGYKVATSRPRDTSDTVRTAKSIYNTVQNNPGLTTVAVAAVGYGLYRWYNGGDTDRKD